MHTLLPTTVASGYRSSTAGTRKEWSGSVWLTCTAQTHRASQQRQPGTMCATRHRLQHTSNSARMPDWGACEEGLLQVGGPGGAQLLQL